MKRQIAKFKTQISSISDVKLRVLSGILLISSAIAGYFSSKSKVDIWFPNTLSRIYPTPYVHGYMTGNYITELLSIAVLLFIVALTLLLLSFRKSITKIRLRLASAALFALSGIAGYFSRGEIKYDPPLAELAFLSASKYYIVAELVALALLLFITATIFLATSFKKSVN